ncbi:uncharacterized protein LOC113374780 [Ctenocephalides felis]|uniref:uncharacterized protein LOC113374780 n=1 Tax=Ctenocephalides felis TaxID=7515 RepID=UPI000E6E3CD4|nr:uncharacterized protein LOC113374780 [Ctenocephalides felis]
MNQDVRAKESGELQNEQIRFSDWISSFESLQSILDSLPQWIFMLLVYNRYNKGPNTEPCGTPQDDFLQRLTESLQHYKQRNDLILQKVQKIDDCEKGVNFMSQISRLHISGFLEDKEYQKSLIMKEPLRPSSLSSSLRAREAFANELFVYEALLPALGQVQDKSATAWPKVIMADERRLVLEDLHESGYRMMRNERVLDLEHCELVVKEIAKFHAKSILLKRKKPEKFYEISNNLHHVVFGEDGREHFSEMLEVSFARGLDSYKNIKRNSSTKILTTLERLKGRIFDLMYQMSKSVDYLLVICHGDLWLNNIMFRYDHQGKPTDLRFVDFQACSLAHPSTDLMRFIYTSTSSQIRKQHLKNLIKLYLDTIVSEIVSNLECKCDKYLAKNNNETKTKTLNLDNHIKAETGLHESSNLSQHNETNENTCEIHSPNSNDFLSKFMDSLEFNTFFEDFKNRSFYGFVTALWLLPVITMDLDQKLFSNENDYSQDNIENYDDNKEINYDNIKLPSEDDLRKMLCNAEYHNKIEQLIEEFSENGWLYNLHQEICSCKGQRLDVSELYIKDDLVNADLNVKILVKGKLQGQKWQRDIDKKWQRDIDKKWQRDDRDKKWQRDDRDKKWQRDDLDKKWQRDDLDKKWQRDDIDKKWQRNDVDKKWQGDGLDKKWQRDDGDRKRQEMGTKLAERDKCEQIAPKRRRVAPKKGK